MNNEHSPFATNTGANLYGESVVTDSAPKLRSVAGSVSAKPDTYSVGTIDESMLTDEERAAVTGIIHCTIWGNYALCGASGVVFACIVLSSFTAFRDGEIPATFLLVVFLYIGREIINGIIVVDNISNLSHILGGVIGSLMGYSLNRQGG